LVYKLASPLRRETSNSGIFAEANIFDFELSRPFG
jgi:hypothetical protein